MWSVLWADDAYHDYDYSDDNDDDLDEKWLRAVMWADIGQHKPTTSMACGRHPGNVMMIKDDGDGGDGDDDYGDVGDH